MTAISLRQPFTPQTLNRRHYDTQPHTKSRTIEVTLGIDKLTYSPSLSSKKYPEYSTQARAKILAHLASTTRPFPLSIRNTDKSLHHQDVADLRELLYLSGEDRWWEINLDDAFCKECVNERLKPHCQTAILDKIPFVSGVAQQITTCLYDAAFYMNKQTSQLIKCPHDTTFTKLMCKIDSETRARLSCVRITGSFQNHAQVASAIHNILILFPNIQNAQVRLPPSSNGPIPDQDRNAYHLATLESSLPKGVALKFQNLLEHQDFMLKWVQVKRKWYQLIPDEVESAQLNKIRNLSDSEEKLIGVSSESINWTRLNRERRFY